MELLSIIHLQDNVGIPTDRLVVEDELVFLYGRINQDSVVLNHATDHDFLLWEQRYGIT